MKSISLRDVSVRFGSVQALDEVSVDLVPGEVTMLAGPNGSGKSTLMGVLLGLVRPNSGGVVLDGEENRTGRWLKERLGYLPEAVAFAPNLSGYQVLRFFAAARGVDTARIGAVLENVQLADAASRAVRGYSRGMIQRLGLAVAVLSEPQLLVLDEPTGGLDQAGISVLWRIIEEQKERGGTILMASHDLVLMEKRVHQVVMLAGGKLRAKGTPEELRARTMLPLRVHFSLDPAYPTVDRFLEAIENLGDCVPQQNGLKVVTEIAPDRLLALLSLQPKFNGTVAGIRIEEPGFDAVYESVLKVEP